MAKHTSAPSQVHKYHPYTFEEHTTKETPCYTESYIFGSDVDENNKTQKTRRDNVVVARKGLKQYRTSSLGPFHTDVFESNKLTIVTFRLEVLYPNQEQFVVCEAKENGKQIEMQIQNAREDPNCHMATYKCKMALVSTPFKNYTIYFKPFHAAKHIKNLPRVGRKKIPNEKLIFAGVVSTHVMDNYGNLTLNTTTQRTYFRLTQHGEVSIENFLASLGQQGLPSPRDELIRKLDTFETVGEFDNSELKKVVLDFQTSKNGDVTVLAQDVDEFLLETKPIQLESVKPEPRDVYDDVLLPEDNIKTEECNEETPMTKLAMSDDVFCSTGLNILE
jgi:hypothetical protein